jgi:hypothetical protein
MQEQVRPNMVAEPFVAWFIGLSSAATTSHALAGVVSLRLHQLSCRTLSARRALSMPPCRALSTPYVGYDSI